MTGVFFEDNTPLVGRQLDALAQGLTDLRPFWPIATRAAIGWISRQFNTEGEAWGDPWAPLSPEYLAWKSEAYPGRGILSAEGDLRRAATSPSREVTPRTLTLTIEPYVKTGPGAGREMDPGWFQLGTDRMPARPLVGESLTEEMHAELRAAAELYVREFVRGIRR